MQRQPPEAPWLHAAVLISGRHWRTTHIMLMLLPSACCNKSAVSGQLLAMNCCSSREVLDCAWCSSGHAPGLVLVGTRSMRLSITIVSDRMPLKLSVLLFGRLIFKEGCAETPPAPFCQTWGCSLLLRVIFFCQRIYPFFRDYSLWYCCRMSAVCSNTACLFREYVCVACRWTPGAGGGKKGGCWFKIRQASQDLLFILVFAIVLTGNILPACSHCPLVMYLQVLLTLAQKLDRIGESHLPARFLLMRLMSVIVLHVSSSNGVSNNHRYATAQQSTMQ